MPDSLEGYLQGAYPVDRATVDTLQRRIGRILEMFHKAFDATAMWPYELVSGKPIEVSAKPSFSTTAMIAYALALATGRITSTALAPAVGDPFGDEEFRRTIGADVDAALKRLDKATKGVPTAVTKRLDPADPKPTPWPPLTDSPTFGPDDPFTLTWLIEVLSSAEDPAQKSFSARLKKRATARIKRVVAFPEANALQIRPREQVAHAFPLLRCVQLANALAKGRNIASVADVGPLRGRFLERIHVQLSESHIADGGFDAADLVFSLEGLLTTSDGDPDFALIDEIFSVITENQERTPYWRPLRPFKVTSQGLILLPQSVEIANSLLRICASDALEERDYFGRHLDLFKRYVSWLQGRLYNGRVAGGPEFSGWESEHTYTRDRIHLWQTSQVLIFLHHYAAMLQREIGMRLLQLAPLVPEPRPPLRIATSPAAVESWRAWSASEPILSTNAASAYRVYERIEADFIAPRVPGSDLPRLYSMLLYGPPGTGKTTIAEKLAEALGYPLLKITPSDFITSGSEAVEARAKAIFRTLEEQRDLVVLFDEVDHLLLDRDSVHYERQGDVFKLLTPGMLTKINDLRRSGRVIFVISTNYYERIDRAIKRPGRIDARYLVMPPETQQRRRHLAAATEDTQMWKNWKSEIRADDLNQAAAGTLFFTYKELNGIVERVADKRRAFRRRTLAKILEAEIQETKPIIEIGAYRARLGISVDETEVHVDDESITVDRPWEEVALLAYLASEAAKWPNEPKWLPEAVREALRKGEVRDAKVASQLKRAVEAVRGRRFLV